MTISIATDTTWRDNTRALALATGLLLLTGSTIHWLGSCTNVNAATPPVSTEPAPVPPDPLTITVERPEPEPVVASAPPASSPKPQPAEPAPEPLAPEPLEAETFVPSAADFVHGQRLLEGNFPRLYATYERIGFTEYAQASLERGGAFFLWDGTRNEPVARLDPTTGQAWEGPISSHLSRWPRDVSSQLTTAIERNRNQFDGRGTHAVLLPPARLDAALLSGLDALLRQNSVDPASVTSFYGAYELREGRLFCVVLSATQSDGKVRNVSFSIALGAARP